MQIEAKLEALGLTLPELFSPPAGTKLPFSWVRVRGNRAYISGHAPQNPDGSLAQPLGKVGSEVSPEEAYQAARLVALAMLGSLKRELGDLVRLAK
jgi:enamine deaminase RidA (YjgF/YER057c/UK114 family)